MTFFDQKEEVLEIELTPYGRYLLSLGELIPAYYSFFDDDVTYDSDCIGFLEDQNVIEDRINETSRLRCQSSYRRKGFRSVETPAEGEGHLALQAFFEREYALNSVLGVSDYYSDHSPSWDINVLKGEITSSATIHTGSGGDGPNYLIPQLNMANPTYKKIAGPPTAIWPQHEIADDLRRVYKPAPERLIEIRNDFILLEVNENNTTFQKENFEIELFEVEMVPFRKGDPREYSSPAAAESIITFSFLPADGDSITLTDSLDNEVKFKFSHEDDIVTGYTRHSDGASVNIGIKSLLDTPSTAVAATQTAVRFWYVVNLMITSAGVLPGLGDPDDEALAPVLDITAYYTPDDDIGSIASYQVALTQDSVGESGNKGIGIDSPSGAIKGPSSLAFSGGAERSEPIRYLERLIPIKFSGPRRNRRSEYVDYFFNIDVDTEIDEYTLCKYKGVDTTKGLFLQRAFDCELSGLPSAERPYSTDVEESGDVCEDLGDS
jgi:hypothetical protein